MGMIMCLKADQTAAGELNLTAQWPAKKLVSVQAEKVIFDQVKLPQLLQSNVITSERSVLD